MRIARASSPFLDGILGLPHQVLDHGFVRVIDYMGDDAAVVQAARVSYGAGTKTVSNDRGLIRYLMRKQHTSPLEMGEIKLHVKLPIFVARQWIRHRTANVNELSARYSILSREFYIPELGRIAEQSQTNKQGSGAAIAKVNADIMRQELIDNSESAADLYELLLNENDDGERTFADRPQLARELARLSLTLNTYTEWYWKVDLHNLLNFLRLRKDGHAQSEIRDYADVIFEMVKGWVPLCAEAFEDYRLNAVLLSKQERDAVALLLQGKVPKVQGLSAREQAEFEQKLKVLS
jgi:thymidylate synthase (FAD)